MIDRVLDWLYPLFPLPREPTPQIVLKPDGFVISEKEIVLATVVWSEVKEIFAFKLDMFTYDTIRLGFRFSDEGDYWQMDEDWPGFKDLLKEIERRFDILDEQWWSKVAFPAFAANRTTLWGEPPAAHEKENR